MKSCVWAPCPLFELAKEIQWCSVCGRIKNDITHLSPCKGPQTLRQLEKPILEALDKEYPQEATPDER